MLKALIILFSFTLGITQWVVADPATPAEASEWYRDTQRMHRWSNLSDEQVKGRLRSQLEQAQRFFEMYPEDPDAIRLYADALHEWGHTFEYAPYNYEEAIRLHSESLRLFRLTPERSQTSANGVIHGIAHIFKDLYDWAILEERNGNAARAAQLFDEAYEFSVLWRFADEDRLLNNIYISDRFGNLLSRKGISLRCAVHFVVDRDDAMATNRL